MRIGIKVTHSTGLRLHYRLFYL